MKRSLGVTALVAGLTLAGAGMATAAPAVDEDVAGRDLGDVVSKPVSSVCGDPLDVIGVLNPAFGNACPNG